MTIKVITPAKDFGMRGDNAGCATIIDVNLEPTRMPRKAAK